MRSILVVLMLCIIGFSVFAQCPNTVPVDGTWACLCWFTIPWFDHWVTQGMGGCEYQAGSGTDCYLYIQQAEGKCESQWVPLAICAFAYQVVMHTPCQGLKGACAPDPDFAAFVAKYRISGNVIDARSKILKPSSLKTLPIIPVDPLNLDPARLPKEFDKSQAIYRYAALQFKVRIAADGSVLSTEYKAQKGDGGEYTKIEDAERNIRTEWVFAPGSEPETIFIIVTNSPSFR